MIVGLAAAVISVSALPFFSKKATAGRFLLSLSVLIVHICACVAYYFYVQSASADANAYYLDKYHMSNMGFGFGTVFTAQFTQVLRKTFGGGFFECFFFFQSIGFWGIALLSRTFEEIQGTAGGPHDKKIGHWPQIAAKNGSDFPPSVDYSKQTAGSRKRE